MVSQIKQNSLLKGKAHFASLTSWIWTWKSLPVWSWIRAADLFRNGHYQRAAKLYRKGLDRHRTHPARNCALMDLARCLYADNKFIEAEKTLRQLSGTLPNSKRVQKALFTLQLRMGLSLDAAWTMRRACRYIMLDEELIGLYLFAVVENRGPHFLLKEVMQFVESLKKAGKSTPLIQAAEIRLVLDTQGYAPKILKKLETIVDVEGAPVEAVILGAEALLKAGKVASARRLLRRALASDSHHPRVLSLFAETYLQAGSFYNVSYALQLAQDACTHSAWRSPREVHVLAEAFFHNEDTLAALATAERARQEGSRLMGTYRDAEALESLIHTLQEDISSEEYQKAS